MKDNLVTPYKFAELKGVDKKSVYKAMQAGRISYEIVEGRKKIDPEKALVEWEKNTNKNLQRNPDKLTQEKKVSNDYNTARTMKMGYEANLAKLEYQEKAKQLVKVSDIQDEFFKYARRIREAILTIPERISHEVAAESDPHLVRQRLISELHIVLDELTNVSETVGNISK